MHLESWWQDLRVSFRHILKSPAASGLSILSVTLGIGMTTGIFSVADAMLLRPIAVDRPAELYRVSSYSDDGQFVGYGWLDYLDMQTVTDSVADLTAFQSRGAMLGAGDEPELVITQAVSPNYFRLLGVRAAIGQTAVEDSGGRPGVVVGHHLWQKRFGGDPHLVGRTILLNKKAFVVSGIMPREFSGLSRGAATGVWISADAWFHVFGDVEDSQTRNGQFQILARLKPGVTAARAGAVLDAAIRGEGKHKAAPAGSRGTFLAAKYALGWNDNLLYGGGLLLILGCVLFIACANVAQLRLAQSESHRKEIAVRMALGGSAGRIGRQLLVETGLLAVTGAGFGILLAQALMEKTAEFLSSGHLYIDYGIRLDARALVYVTSALLLSILLSGMAPFRLALRLNVWDVVKSEQGVAGSRAGWQKRALIAGQVAVSVALLGCAILFLGSLRAAAAIHPGLDPGKKLLVLTLRPGSDTAGTEWCEAVCERLSTLPGVRGATYARRLPLSDSGGGYSVRVEIPGRPPARVLENNVGGNYFQLLGTRLVAGRGIEPGDRAGSQPVVVVSRNFASQLLAGADPLGQWIKVSGKMRQVVGISEDGPSNDLHEAAAPYLFLPYTQVPLDDLTLIVESAGSPNAQARVVKDELKRYDPRIHLFTTGTLRQSLDEALSQDTMMASLASGLGAFGILLTAAGLFGVLQFSVNRRTRELGLRMALGARTVEIQRLVLGESLRMAAWGIPFGLVLLAVGGWFARTLVLGISPLDPRIYLESAAGVLSLTLLAGWLPARRATRVDPMEALRTD